jgi:hypothetical protein
VLSFEAIATGAGLERPTGTTDSHGATEPRLGNPRTDKAPRGFRDLYFYFLIKTTSFLVDWKASAADQPTGLCYRLASSLGKSLLFFAPQRPRSSRSSRSLGFPGIGITGCTATGGGVPGTGSSLVSS